MAKDPAVLFYTNDFLSGTFTMSNEQVGMYIRLLCLQHQKGQLTEKDMLSICKAYDEEVYLKFDNKNGIYTNERMKNESERRKKFSESRRKNAQSTNNQTDKPKNISSAYAKHMETETETVNETINRTKTETEKLVFPFNSEQFLKVWKVLTNQPKWKRKTQEALQTSLKKLSKYPEPVSIEMMENTIEGNWQGLFELKNNKNENNNGQFAANSGKLGTSDARIAKARSW